ncbi:MAG: alanine racemase [Alphaproteobacteria bacterium]|nr:alanine racemase [Alphaproteobacteria bacterium]
MAADPVDRASAVLEIDLDGIVANWRSLRARVEPAGCAAVVKADAYGLGAGPVAEALATAGCRLFFVATLDEGIALRRALPDACEIAVFNGPPPGTADEFVFHRLVPVLNEPGQIAEWGRIAARRGGLPAMLHVDTGMARLGLTRRELDVVADDPALRNVIGWRALISHLACADEAEHPLNEKQRVRFIGARERMSAAAASLAASSGIFLGPGFHFDFVRPGAALYGVNPQPGAANPMRQVVRLRGRILQVRELEKGETVGYGAAHVTGHPSRLATVALGYADGWLRSLSHRGSGRLGGKRFPILGRVSMDLIVLDVTGADPSLVRPAGFVDLLDEDYGVDAAAADAGTIGYEILTGLGRRCYRIYRGALSQC